LRLEIWPNSLRCGAKFQPRPALSFSFSCVFKVLEKLPAAALLYGDQENQDPVLSEI
jgi:hypothetical protein